MKKLNLLFVLFLGLTLTSCSDSKVEEVAAFEFNGAWYWIAEYNPEATKQEIKDFATTYGDPRATNYFFFYVNSRLDPSVFKKEKFSKSSLFETLVQAEPDTSYYKMSTDQSLQEDAMFVVKSVVDENN